MIHKKWSKCYRTRKKKLLVLSDTTGFFTGNYHQYKYRKNLTSSHSLAGFFIIQDLFGLFSKYGQECMHLHMYAYVYMYMYMCLCGYGCILRVCVFKFVCVMYVCACVYVGVRVRVRVRVYACTCMRACACMRANIHVCAYIRVRVSVNEGNHVTACSCVWVSTNVVTCKYKCIPMGIHIKLLCTFTYKDSLSHLKVI